MAAGQHLSEKASCLRQSSAAAQGTWRIKSPARCRSPSAPSGKEALLSPQFRSCPISRERHAGSNQQRAPPATQPHKVAGGSPAKLNIKETIKAVDLPLLAGASTASGIRQQHTDDMTCTEEITP
jgi:hypothetical protein